MSAEQLVFWDGQILGQLQDIQTDHGYFEGDMIFESGEIAEKFITALKTWLDGKPTVRERFDVIGQDADKAVWVSLREGDSPMYFVWHIENVVTHSTPKAHLAMKMTFR